MEVVLNKRINIKLWASLSFLLVPMAEASFFTMNDLRDREIEKLIKRSNDEMNKLRNTPYVPRGAREEESSDDNSYSGKGHKLGGNKYANNLLGIDAKKGRYLAKQAHYERKKRNKSRRHSVY